MTLKEFFDLLAVNPFYILAYFTLIPGTAFIGSIIGKGEGNTDIWRYFYSILIYLVAVPGIFSVTLNVYFFLFERRSVMQADVYTQILPIVSMVATMLIIRKAAGLTNLPGFDKLSGLIWMIAAVLVMMWFLEKTHIVVFSYIPIHYVLLILVGLLVVIRLGWSRLSN